MKDFVAYFKSHNLDITPAGMWELGEDGIKKAIDSKRVDNLPWSQKYKDDNMGRIFLHEHDNILVLDIDGHPSVIQGDDTEQSITISTLDITIPIGLYTTTTRPDKFHIYYKLTDAQRSTIPKRLVKLNGLSIDIFTYGVVFEGHTFSPHNTLNKGIIPPLPEALYDIIQANVKQHSTKATSAHLGLTSNIQRYNIIKMFLNDELIKNKQWNSFFKSVMPVEYQPDNKYKLSIDSYPLSYDLFNKLAVKLTTTSELDYHEHVIPTLDKMLKMWGKEPNSNKSRELLDLNILPSLPRHESIFKYDYENDVTRFQDHLNAQPATTSPIFRVIERNRIFYIEVSKLTQTPIIHGSSYFLEQKAAQALHPERDIVSEEGRVIGWDDNVPIVYTINSPYEPQYILDTKYDRHTINLYTPTEYVQMAEPTDQFNTSNLIYRTLYSIIGPDYLSLYLSYAAQVVYGKASPTMVLWVAALSTELGGSGKSVATLELFSLLLGTAATSVDVKTVSSGWGDIITSTKILSLEDMPQQTPKEWEITYGNIKQQNTNSYRKLNMKGGGVTSQRVSVGITGSTNYRLKLSASDRRFFCLEPAHFHGITEPLSNEDRLALATLLQSNVHEQAIQEYANYLLYIFNKGFDEDTTTALFIEAPQTVYRNKWVSAGASNSQNLLYALSHAEDLIALCKYDTLSKGVLDDLLKMIVLAYNPATGKSAVSWKWFEHILPFVQSDRYSENSYSKANIAAMLSIDFVNVGVYANSWKEKLPSNFNSMWASWPCEGYTFPVDKEDIAIYNKEL